MLFLANLLSKMKHNSKLGSRIAEVHNGSSLFTGDAGQGESNIRRWIIENDWLEAIVALPLNMFYNTGIATYVWVLNKDKPAKRRARENRVELDKVCRGGFYAAACRISERHGLEQVAGIGNSRCVDNVAGRKCQTESRWQHPHQGPVGYGLHPASDECVVLRQRVGAAAAGIMSQASKPWRYPSASVRPMDEAQLDQQARQSIWLLAGATLLLLVTAGANLSSLTLAQVVARTRDVAVQSALGATRFRLVRQALAEQCLIGLSGLGFAVPLTWIAISAAQSLMPERFTVYKMHVAAVDVRAPS
jgi:hypothetical protein